MASTSTAFQFFERMVTGGAAAIESLVDDRQHETEWLDFKSGEHLGDIKATWSEAVCGFANNQGGVLIVGIDARKDSGIDAACGVKPVESPASLRTQMLDLLRTNVEPPVPGVEVKDILRIDGRGFVVCYVPESENKPHRAEQVKNKPYLIRIADSFQNPSPSLLRSLFFPKSATKLEVVVISKWQDVSAGDYANPPPHIRVVFEVKMRNQGLVSAKDIYARIKHSLPVEVAGPYTAGIERGTRDVGIEHPRPLHPSSNAQLCTLTYLAGVAKVVQKNDTYWRPAVEKMSLEIDVYAADMTPLYLSVTFDDWEIDARAVKVTTQR